MSNTNLEVLCSLVSDIDSRLKIVEKFVSKWTSGEEGVSFNDTECNKGVLSCKLSTVEKKLVEVTDRMLAIDLQLTEIRMEWPNPAEAAESHRREMLRK